MDTNFLWLEYIVYILLFYKFISNILICLYLHSMLPKKSNIIGKLRWLFKYCSLFYYISKNKLIIKQFTALKFFLEFFVIVLLQT